MEELSRLMQIIADYGSKSYPLINFNDDTNLENRFATLIKTNQITCDEKAAEQLYGNKILTANYRMLKSRFKKKLLNHLHFVNLPEDKFHIKVSVKRDCSAALLEAETLISIGEVKLADKILTVAFNKAIKNEVYDYVIPILELQKWCYQMLRQKSKFDKAAKLNDHFNRVDKAEREATQIYQEVTLAIYDKVQERSKFITTSSAVLKRLNSLWEESKSSKIFNYIHLLSIHEQELLGNYHSIFDLIKKGEILVSEGKVHKNWFNSKYNAYISVYALLQTRQYELGLKEAKEKLKFFDKYSLNWFAYMENYFLLALHSRKYKLSAKVISEVFDELHLNKISEHAQERWKLYRYYDNLVQLYLNKEVNQFNVSNSLPESLVQISKDKQGYNVALVVLDILKDFSNSELDIGQHQIDRINNYTTTYIKGANAERARLFMKLLLLAIKENLNYRSIIEEDKPLLTRLKEIPIPGDAFAEVEILPYEHLWALVLEIIKARKS